MDMDEQEDQGPKPEKPAVLDTRAQRAGSMSMTLLHQRQGVAGGEPIRVQPRQRVLMHLLNASAMENRRIALPGHQFQVLALDGNPVPTPAW